MYHGVIRSHTDVPSDREEGAQLYDLSSVKFQEQLEFLKREGYQAAVLDQQAAIGNQSIVLTFDDGERNNFTQAFTLLRQLNCSAYFFITVSRVGKPGYMNWEELKELRDAGMVVGSHGLNHNILVNQKDKVITKELRESKDILEYNLKVNVEDFSVSRGFYNQQILDAARNVGYKRIFVSDAPVSTSPECINRVAVKGDWSMQRFEQALHDQTPVNEQITNVSKNVLKGLLGGAGYDRVRNLLLKIRR